MHKVLVLDNVAKEGVEVLKSSGIFQVDVKPSMSPDELKKIIGEYDGVIVRSATKLTRDVLESAGKLKAIGRAGIGLDNIDVGFATLKGIVVMNTPQENALAAAEHTMAMMLSAARNIPQANASMKEGKWEKKKFTGVQLYGKTLGIIGLGNIGSIVADRAKGLKMKVIAFDPYISEEKAKKMGVELASLNELYERSDIITVHTPLTKETKGLVDSKAFSLMKDGVIVINCARGGIIDEEALLEALNSGKVRCAALDVFSQEPPGKTPLVLHERVICTPHLGASTAEAQKAVAISIANQFVEFFKKGVAKNAVNMPRIEPETYEVLLPFVKLGEKMGSFLAQISDISVEEVYIEYQGEISSQNVDPVTAGILKGIMETYVSGVNYVNASVVAKERGIKVYETKSSDEGDYYSSITVKIKGKEGENSVMGTLFGKKEQRIVKINNFSMEVVPEGDLLFFINLDRPGVIGNLGTTLAEENINIGSMFFGREKPGGMAISILKVDSKPDRKLIEKLSKLPNILKVKYVSL